MRRYGIVLGTFSSLSVILSLIWRVAYLYTAIGVAVWSLGGHLITIDDDLPGEGSNPDGSIPFPSAELAIKAAVLLVLVGLVFFFPLLRTLGA